jgi:hypothetical protein
MALAPFADIEARIAAVTNSRLSNAYVVLANGVAFGAEMNASDEIGFEYVTVGTHQLTYLSSYSLAKGEEISVNGAFFVVATTPRKTDGHFSACEVVQK